MKSVPFQEGLRLVGDKLKAKASEGAGAAGNGEPQLPNLPAFKKVVSTEEKQAATEKAAEALRNYADEAIIMMDEYASRVWACLEGDEYDREAHASEFATLSGAIREHAQGPNRIASEKAVEAFSDALVRHCPAKRWAITALLSGPAIDEKNRVPGLLELGVIQELVTKQEEDPPQNGFRFFGKTYRVVIKDHLTAAVISSNIKTKLHEATAAATENFRGLTAKLQEQATANYAFQDLLDGKPGRLCLKVPDDERGGHRLHGGVLLVESDGTEVKVVDAIGRFQRRMLVVREHQQSLPIATLREDEFKPKSRLPGPVFDDRRLIHQVIVRTVREVTEREEHLKVKQAFIEACGHEEEALRKKATIASERWLLDEEPGIALISLKRWGVKKEKREDSFFFVSFLVERKDSKIRIFEFPKRLKELFREPKLLEPTHPGEKFGGLAYPLGSMLRAAHKKTLSTENKAAQAAAEPPAPPAEEPTSAEPQPAEERQVPTEVPPPTETQLEKENA